MPKLSDGPSAPAHVDFPVVGLGASAGGVPALQTFFEALPATTGAAYVVLLHLPAEHTSNLDAVLQVATSMPVAQISTGMPLAPNRIYVAPPSCMVSIADGRLEATPISGAYSIACSIDALFRSLAEAAQERAIAIVLSGAGSDGSVGIKRIKECGGISIAQNPSEAEHDGMPRTAIATGLIDFTLSVSEMPQRLLDLWSNEGRTSRLNVLVQTDDTDQSGNAFSERNQRALREILIVLRTRTGHDFKRYKRASLLRRIERRLQINGLTDLQQYRDYLHLHTEETKALLQDLLVSTTHFFRDRDAFEKLRVDVLPLIFARRGPDDPVRVWVAGCATGEEAYSLAMLLHEASAKTATSVPFQVFATDIDDRAIGIARQGAYAHAALADVDPARVKRYFVKNGADYQIKRELRERVLFALHNVLRDPPFSRLDLICCRNLLIYLDQAGQVDTLQAFRFALKPGGFLFLGSSETPDATGSLFTCMDKQARIFSSDPGARATRAGAANDPRATGLAALPLFSPTYKRPFSFGDLHGRLLEDHALPSVLINRDSGIVHVSDRAGRFLQFVGGEPSHNVLAAIRPELRGALRKAIFMALQSRHRIDTRPVRFVHDGAPFAVRMIARTVHDDESNDDFVLILFDEIPDSTAEPDESAADSNAPIIAQLEHELQSMKARLQRTVEEYETSNEELRASNEELLAINAQLRLTAEHLEIDKDTLAATNSELKTLNTDLQARMGRTNKINDDLQNLIVASDIGTIFVDRTLRIMRFTPRAADVFEIFESDIGRSLLEIPHRLQYASLEHDAAQAFDSLRLIEREVRSNDGRWFSARLQPYMTTRNVIEGAVLSFIDITSRRIAEERLHSASQTALEEVERRQDEFLAVVSHELKHPLNLISANAELIARSPTARAEPALARAADTITRTVAGQAQIIDDLLDISRVRTGNLSITRVIVDLADVVHRICDTVDREARADGIRFACTIPDHPVTIEADLTRIEQVLWNLVSNALKYTGPGGSIEVALREDDALARLIVSDTGMGIDPGVIPYIFEMFQRGQNAGVTRSGGLGIGLSLVKELVALHGGRVSAHSDGLGRGAVFTVELPRAAGQSQAIEAGSLPPALLRNTEVVLVDDDRETVEAFKLLLETEGASVVVATAGDEALQILDERCPSFILSDLGMPGMSGVELIEAVRKRNRLTGVKAIALSGFGRDSDVQAALRAGFDAYLTKPVTLDALLNTMARLRAR
ncbi:chemotaxis protein CheB [Trinickia diaoshuihuensis]|uniref:chemotaxis protein CheB n=1 Tax=Trinickia diaoshuihuensis TaxID=2292265 RepID=UPI000E22052E|nr:chemotaxis protein CheB [Trinickia diaoshuihuensis]